MYIEDNTSMYIEDNRNLSFTTASSNWKFITAALLVICVWARDILHSLSRESSMESTKLAWFFVPFLCFNGSQTQQSNDESNMSILAVWRTQRKLQPVPPNFQNAQTPTDRWRHHVAEIIAAREVLLRWSYIVLHHVHDRCVYIYMHRDRSEHFVAATKHPVLLWLQYLFLHIVFLSFMAGCRPLRRVHLPSQPCAATWNTCWAFVPCCSLKGDSEPPCSVWTSSDWGCPIKLGILRVDPTSLSFSKYGHQHELYTFIYYT